MAKRMVRLVVAGWLTFSSGVGLVAAQETTASGQFRIHWGDGPSGSGEFKTQFLLIEDSGQTIQLLLSDEVAEPFGGPLGLDRRRVSVSGTSLAQPSAQPDSPPLLRVGTLDLDEPAQPSVVAPAAVLGSQRWVTILCRFGDSKSVTPQPASYFDSLMGTASPGLDHYWRESSYGMIDLTGSVVVGWYNLPQPRSYYVYDMNGDGVDNLDHGRAATDCTAVADGAVFFPSFDGINLMFNERLDCCAWGGGRALDLDGVFKSYDVTWMPPWGYANQYVLGHEMGHGFGLPHSSGPYTATYDSEWDVMSSGGTCSPRDSNYGCVGVHTISHHKDRLGWIPSGRKFLHTGGSQTISMERLGQPVSGSDFLMAQIPIGSSTAEFYTVEVRRFAGYDAQVPDEAVVIHRVDTTRFNRSAQVVDPDGNGDPNDAGAMWLPGETFTDTANNISVSVDAATAFGFQVTISESAPPDPRMNVDSPATGASLLSTFSVSGWAVDLGAPTGTGVDLVHVWAFLSSSPNDFGVATFLGSATLGVSRPDVGAFFGSSQFDDSGYRLDTSDPLPQGNYLLKVYARSTVTGTFDLQELSVAVTGPVTRMNVDRPANGSVVGSPFAVSGWAFNTGSPGSVGIDLIHVWAFPNGSGNDFSQATFLGSATLGLSRPDVAAYFGAPELEPSGFHLTVTTPLPVGGYTLRVYAWDTATGTFTTQQRSVTVSSDPRLAVDQPAPGAAVAVPFTVKGWAADLAASTGTGIDAVHVWAFPSSSPNDFSQATFLGAATLGVSRPDVAAFFGKPALDTSGYQLNVTTPLTSGSYTLKIYARSTVTGAWISAPRGVSVP